MSGYQAPDLLSDPMNSPAPNTAGGDPFSPGAGGTVAVDPFSPGGWVEESNPPVNPNYSTGRTATPPMNPEYSSDQSTSSVPSHSAYYQPSQPSEAEEIARRKAEAEAGQGQRGIGGAAALAGVAGLCLMGPLVGVAAAGGAAYVAATRKGPVGSALRAGGQATTSVASSAQKFNQKHQVMQKTAKSIGTGVGWVTGKFNGARRGNQAS